MECGGGFKLFHCLRVAALTLEQTRQRVVSATRGGNPFDRFAQRLLGCRILLGADENVGQGEPAPLVTLAQPHRRCELRSRPVVSLVGRVDEPENTVRLRALGRQLNRRLELLNRRVDRSRAECVGRAPHSVAVLLIDHEYIASRRRRAER